VSEITRTKMVTPAYTGPIADDLNILAGPAAIICTGQSAPGDNGGGIFYWDPASSASHDGVNVIQLLSGGRGRWVRVSTAGAVGPSGPTGAAGTSVRTGNGAPSNALGNDGDVYVDLVGLLLHAPKAAGVWPSGVSLRGPSGQVGAQGQAGVSVVSAEVDGSGHLVLTLSDASTIDAGVVYTLPTASTTVLGGVKVDGSTITIAGGVISGAFGVEQAVDAVAAALAAGTHSRVTITYDDAAGTISVVVDPPDLAPVDVTFTAASDAYKPFHKAMTLNIAGAVTAGTGTFTYAKALAASPTSFSAITTSTSFAAGDVLKITAASVTGYCAVTIPRTA
jgi:hypothetical protein